MIRTFSNQSSIDKQQVEDLAAKLSGIYAKYGNGNLRKWHHLNSHERSLWRLIARAALEHPTIRTIESFSAFSSNRITKFENTAI
jgi:hypothetical protein